MQLYKSGAQANHAGTYIEVGHGGGKVKKREIIELKENDVLPELKPYEITIHYKGETKTRKRQHNWLSKEK
jgi:hypothetical protein